jgi:hypothetical protein
MRVSEAVEDLLGVASWPAVQDGLVDGGKFFGGGIGGCHQFRISLVFGRDGSPLWDDDCWPSLAILEKLPLCSVPSGCSVLFVAGTYRCGDQELR